MNIKNILIAYTVAVAWSYICYKLQSPSLILLAIFIPSIFRAIGLPLTKVGPDA